MGNYYDYTDEFDELITNTETIIENQETLNALNVDILNINYTLTFAYILVFTLSIVRKVLRVK